MKWALPSRDLQSEEGGSQAWGCVLSHLYKGTGKVMWWVSKGSAESFKPTLDRQVAISQKRWERGRKGVGGWETEGQVWRILYGL